MFTRSSGDRTQLGAKLVGSDASGPADQGWSVALSGNGDTAAIGGPSDGNGPGATWVFTRTGGALTHQSAKLVGSDASGPAKQGRSVALSVDGSTALVGAIADDNSIGAAWVFTGSGTTTAGAPVVSGERVLGVGQTSATIGAAVNPNGQATRYHVEWGLTAAYGSQGPSLPTSGTLTGQADHAVGAQLTGLAPATTYHWRLVATNASGNGNGVDETVTAASPGGRGNTSPTATFTFTPPGRLGARTVVSAAGSTGNGSPIVSYKWDWTHDGSYDATCGGGDPVAMPVYTHVGTYNLGLQVTAADGESSTSVSAVTVSHIPTGVPSGVGPVAGYACGSLVHSALCTNHIEWDLIVADALDNGCFTELPVLPGTPTAACRVCAHGAAAGGAATYVPPSVVDLVHMTNARAWTATGRVPVNGTIIAPLTQLI